MPIRRNALRSFLTVLGIVIGVAAVIAMVTIGNGTTAKVTASAKLGSNLLFVSPGQFGPGRASSDAKPFNARDIEAMRAQLLSVRAVAPVGQKSVTVIFGTESRNTTVTGTDNDYFITQDWDLPPGRTFTDGELRAGSAVCIIGETVRKKLFGRAIRSARSCASKTFRARSSGFWRARASRASAPTRTTVLMPLRALQRRFAGNTDVALIYVSANDGADTTKVQADIETSAARAAQHHHLARRTTSTSAT